MLSFYYCQNYNTGKLHCTSTLRHDCSSETRPVREHNVLCPLYTPQVTSRITVVFLAGIMWKKTIFNLGQQFEGAQWNQDLGLKGDFIGLVRIDIKSRPYCVKFTVPLHSHTAVNSRFPIKTGFQISNSDWLSNQVKVVSASVSQTLWWQKNKIIHDNSSTASWTFALWVKLLHHFTS